MLVLVSVGAVKVTHERIWFAATFRPTSLVEGGHHLLGLRIWTRVNNILDIVVTAKEVRVEGDLVAHLR